MKSIKPGRGPSAMEAIGSIAVGIFGVIWTFAAANMGAPIFFVLFGIVFVGLAVIQGIYHFKMLRGQIECLYSILLTISQNLIRWRT
ncbi:hypothetical protein [Paenibacillus thiaminolyticus]|uniref:hypothetical protein n=1 Tax=Paenibacillus thiaminolyticus TaxID=49283 RepID=UPI001F0F400E|nr:hypothetical protein [Paenibacillus thiaminolyticus]